MSHRSTVCHTDPELYQHVCHADGSSLHLTPRPATSPPIGRPRTVPDPISLPLLQHNFAADFLHQLLTTYRSSTTIAQVAHLVPVLLQVCATPHFLRYLRLNGPEAFVNDHNKVMATFDVESIKVS